MPPIAREVRDYIAGHPSVSDALKMGIVNYSALARKISKELGIRQKEAVLAACRRYPVEKLRGYRGRRPPDAPEEPRPNADEGRDDHGRRRGRCAPAPRGCGRGTPGREPCVPAHPSVQGTVIIVD